jgi:glycosidase
MDNARSPMLFGGDERNLTLKAFVKKLIELRAEHDAFKSTEVRILHADERGIVYSKNTAEETVLILLNAADTEQSLPLNLPEGSHHALDLLNGAQAELTEQYVLAPYGTAVLQLGAH